MNQPHKVKCLDAAYDQDNEVLVLNCWFFAQNSQRMVVLARSDFHYKDPSNEVPHNEMRKTANLFKGKEFNLVVEDDPNRKQILGQEGKYAEEFKDKVADEMNNVAEGLANDDKVQRNLARLIDDGKLDINRMIDQEMAFRAKVNPE